MKLLLVMIYLTSIPSHPTMSSSVYEDINRAVGSLVSCLDNRSGYMTCGEEEKRIASVLKSITSSEETQEKKRRLEPTAQLELVLPALPLIKDLLLIENDTSLMKAAIAFVGTITEGPNNKGIEAVQAVSGLTTRLVALLAHKNKEVKKAALLTVKNMLSGTKTQVRCCVDGGCVDAIISLLKSDEDEDLELAAIEATEKILTHAYSIQDALEKGMLTTLRDLLPDATHENQKPLLKAIGKLCKHGTTEQRAQLGSSGLLNECCVLLSRVSDRRALYIMDVLNALLKAAERDDYEYDFDLGSKKVLPNLCWELGEMDVLDIIKDLIRRNKNVATAHQLHQLRTTVRYFFEEKDCIFEGGKNFTPEEIVKELKSKTLETKIRAACAARRMVTLALCEVGEVSRLWKILDIMVKAGALKPLITALGNRSSYLQQEAVWTLASITHTEKYIPAVVKAGAIPKLVTLLYNDSAIAEKAAIALGNIASHKAETIDKVLDGGAEKAILYHLRPETPLKELRGFVVAFEKLAHVSQSKSTFELLSVVLPNISKLLSVITDDRFLVHACLGVSDLTKGKEERIEAIQAVEGLTTHLIDLLKHEAVGVQKAALQALLNMLAGSSTQVDRCLDAGCLDHIVRLLQSSDSTVVECAIYTTNNIFAKTPSQIQRALNKDMFSPLHNILADKTSDCRAKAAKAIANLCYHGSAAQRQQLVSSDMLEPYCALLEGHDSDVVKNLLDGLEKLLETNHDDFNGEALRSRLKELGVRGQIEKISKSSNKEIKTTACHLLETYRNF